MLTCLMREARTLSMVKILYASCTHVRRQKRMMSRKTCMQPKHLAHLIFKNELLHLIIEQPFASFQHEFVILQSGDLRLSLLRTRGRLHQLEIHGSGVGNCIEGQVIRAFHSDVFEEMQPRVESLSQSEFSAPKGFLSDN